MAADKGQIQNVQTKGTKDQITAKTVLQCRVLKASKGNVNGEETKAKVQTTAK